MDLTGRILICIAGLATTMLSITGIVIWLKKRKARAARQSRLFTKLNAKMRPAG